MQRNEFRPKLLDNTRKYSYPNYPLSLVKRFNKRDIYSKLISKGSKISLANSRVLFRSRREDQEREREKSSTNYPNIKRGPITATSCQPTQLHHRGKQVRRSVQGYRSLPNHFISSSSSSCWRMYGSSVRVSKYW